MLRGVWSLLIGILFRLHCARGLLARELAARRLFFSLQIIKGQLYNESVDFWSYAVLVRLRKVHTQKKKQIQLQIYEYVFIGDKDYMVFEILSSAW